MGEDKYLGIGLYKKEYLEAVEQDSMIPYEKITEHARGELEEEIAKKLFPGSILVDKKVTDDKINEETVRVTVMMEFVENIGQERSTTQN